MQDLLSGLDSSVFDVPPSPDVVRKPASTSKTHRSPLRHIYNTPIKPKRFKSSVSHITSPLAQKTPRLNPENDDVGSLLEGAEDWDWDDMNSDFLTPKKSPKRRVSVSHPRAIWCTDVGVGDTGYSS